MLQEIGCFCFDFNPVELYPGYRDEDDSILGIVRNNKLLELYSAQTDSDENDNDIMVNLNRLRIEEMDFRHVDFLYYFLYDNTFKLSSEVLTYIVENKIVTTNWVIDYLSKVI